jgi:hypothetical protein
VTGDRCLAAPRTGPVFIVGSMRSGSTLLRLILDTHPAIAIGPESGFMGAVAAVKQIPGWQHGAGWYRRLGCTDDELDERLRDFFDDLFRRHAHAQGKRRWGDKTPFHTEHIDQMRQVFPDADFVGIVRHPAAVAWSLHRRFHYSLAEAAAYWTATNADLLDGACRVGKRFLVCRYEDLVTHPEPVLREVVGFLGEAWYPALLEHQLTHAARGTARAAEGGTSTRDPVDPDRAGQWAAHATPADLAQLGETAALGRFFGYRPTVPEPDPPPAASGSARVWTATGDELAGRRQPLPDGVADRRPVALPPDADPVELARQLARVRAALERTRSRRAVRVVDALRLVQHGRSVAAGRRAWALLRTHGLDAADHQPGTPT